MNIEKIISKIIGVILIIILVKIAFGILFAGNEHIQNRFKERANQGKVEAVMYNFERAIKIRLIKHNDNNKNLADIP